jgi:hypothetical protein
MGKKIAPPDPNIVYPKVPKSKADRQNGVFYTMDCGKIGRWNGMQMKSWKNHERARKYNREKSRQTVVSPRCKRRYQTQKIKKLYNLSPKAYLQLFTINDGGCHLCSKPLAPFTQAACVDHEPGTGYAYIEKTKDSKAKYQYTGKPANVRGILCHGCNRSMTAVDRPEWLLKAIDYASRTNLKE